MNRDRLMYRTSSDGMISQFSSSGNSLGIMFSHSSWDLIRSQMTLLIETDQSLKDEIDARMNDNLLILEAPLDSYYDRPIRTHLVGQEILNSFENGLSVVGSSEVELKPGYQYSILSCRLVNSRQIQVIFEFRSRISNKHN